MLTNRNTFDVSQFVFRIPGDAKQRGVLYAIKRRLGLRFEYVEKMSQRRRDADEHGLCVWKRKTRYDKRDLGWVLCDGTAILRLSLKLHH